MIAIIKRHKNLLPIIVLACLCLNTAYQILFLKVEYEGTLYDRSFSVANILAFASVLINLCIYSYSRRYFRYSVGLTVLLGLFGILNFTANAFTAETKVSGVMVLSYQPLSLLIGLLYLAINFRQIKAKMEGPSKPDLICMPDRQKVDDFKIKYQNKTVEELEALAIDKRYLTEANVAAAELLTERVNISSC